ncbi:MAG: DUF5050 domain-containing protein [Bacillota bacterium]|nr:DUF5050 domain-containing protein [Bacillota bacterium]
MKKLYRCCLLLLTAALLLSGCKKSSVTSATADAGGSQVTTAKAYQSGSDSGSSINASGFNPATPGLPVKASSIVVSGGIIYYCNWSDGDKLYKINANGTGKQKLSDDAASALILSNDTIYYSNESDYLKLYSINIDGTGKQKLFDEKVSNMILMDSYLYFIDSSDKIAALDTSSGVKTPLNINSRYFDTDGNQIFFEDFDGSQSSFNAANLDGTNSLKINDDAPLGIVSDQGILYYINTRDGSRIYKISQDGTGKTKLNDSESSNIEIDSGWIYYINHSDFEKLYKIKLDGSGNVKLSDEDFIKSFAVAGNFVYFDKNTEIQHPIYKVNK